MKKISLLFIATAILATHWTYTAARRTTPLTSTPITEVPENTQMEPMYESPTRSQAAGQESKISKTKTTPSGSQITTSNNTLIVNGQSVSCEGSTSVVNGEFFCNGKKVQPNQIVTITPEENKKIVEQNRVIAEQAENRARRAIVDAQNIAKNPIGSQKMSGRTQTTTINEGMVTVNGQSVSCKGSVSVINGEIFCNGKKVQPKK